MRSYPRLAAMIAALGVTTAALVSAPALSVAPTSSADAASAVCAVARGFYPNLHGAPTLRNDDTDVNVYVGGQFDAKTNAAEGEGTFVIGGDATFDTSVPFYLGVVGVGSQVTPPAMSDMLVTGGDVRVPGGSLDVGNPIGGNVVTGGTVVAPSIVITNGGTITQNAAAPLAPYAAVATGYQELSTAYAAMGATGTTSVTSWEIRFTGDGTTNRQVFDLTSADLAASAASRSIVFDNIPLGTIVVVNVTGQSPRLWANSFWDGATQIIPDDTGSTIFSQRTQALLWNFVDATDVTLGDGDQLPGSILIPTPGSTTTILTSINGRFYTEGDVVFGGSTQTGLEFHNYPFREEACGAVTTGSLSIAKALVDADSVFDATRVYIGTYSCTDSASAVVASGPWSITAGGPAFTTPPVAAGSVCTVAEDALTAPPTTTDASYIWRTPVVSPASTTVVASVTPSAVTVTNEVRRATGGLEMVKVLDDPYDVVDLTRFYTGTFECVYADGSAPLRGTWREQAGSPPVLLASGVPIGTVCTLAEDPILVPPLPGFPQYQWAAPRISPTTVTVVENTVGRFTVTNIVVDPVDPASLPTVRESLPVTGASSYGPLGVGVVMLLLGLLGLLIKTRQQRARGDR